MSPGGPFRNSQNGTIARGDFPRAMSSCELGSTSISKPPPSAKRPPLRELKILYPIYEGVGSVKQKSKKSMHVFTPNAHTSPGGRRRAVKGARRAFILTLDSPSRPTQLKRERSETKFSEASFPAGSLSLVGFSAKTWQCNNPSFERENRHHRSISKCFHSAPTKGSRVIIPGELGSTQPSIRSKLRP